MRRWFRWLALAALLVAPLAHAQETDRPAAPLLDAANSALEAGNIPLAIRYYNRFIALNPDTAEGYARRSIAFMLARQYPQAHADLDTAIQLTEADDNTYLASLYVQKAEVFIRQRLLGDAFDAYARAIELDPDYALAYQNRGILYDVLEQYDQALADYDRTLALAPDNAPIYINRARIHRLLGDLPSGIADLSAAIALQPDEAEYYILRGHFYAEMGDARATAADYAAWLEKINTSLRQIRNAPPAQTLRLSMRYGVVYQIPITVRLGDRINIVANSSTVDPLVVLLDASGTPVIADDDSGFGVNAFINDYLAETEGEYTILVGHARGGWQGTVRFTYELLPFGGV